jgi:hypothetical protein
MQKRYKTRPKTGGQPTEDIVTTTTHIETETSLSQAYAQLESIKGMVDAHMAGKGCDGYEFASEAIQDDPLSVQVRSGWTAPGYPMEAAEYEILLCTGGPAVRIVGTLDQWMGESEPDTATLEHQNWGTPWTDAPIERDDEQTLLTYARQFYFGE